MSTSKWAQRLDVREAETLKRCEADPNFDAIHEALVKVEMEAHRRQWDNPLNFHRLFEVVRAPNPHEMFPGTVAAVGVRWLEEIQDEFDHRCEQRDGNVGMAVVDLAAAFEHFREGHDVHAVNEGGFELYGVGFLSEAWSVEGTSEEEAAEVDRLLAQRQLHLHPKRREMRVVHVAGRDGIMWSGTRFRGERLRIIAEMPDSDDRHIGNIVHGLSRATAALVGNPVPIWPCDVDRPTGEDFWRTQRS